MLLLESNEVLRKNEMNKYEEILNLKIGNIH